MVALTIRSTTYAPGEWKAEDTYTDQWRRFDSKRAAKAFAADLPHDRLDHVLLGERETIYCWVIAKIDSGSDD